MTQPGPIIAVGFLVFGLALQASAQPPAAATDEAAVAFVDVNLIRMDRERVETGRTVLTRGGRITAIGPRSAVTVPDDAIVVQGEGRYLTPGLTDGHVHLEGDGTLEAGRARTLAMHRCIWHRESPRSSTGAERPSISTGGGGSRAASWWGRPSTRRAGSSTSHG